MNRPPVRRPSPAILLIAGLGAITFAATGTFVLAPWLFPRKPGEFSIPQVLLTGFLGMFGGLIGVAIGQRLFSSRRRR